MRKKVIIYVLAIAAVIALVKLNSEYNFVEFFGADSGIKIGWKESSGLDFVNAKYTKFSGVKNEKISLKEGETITFSFESEVEKGELLMKFMDSQRNIISEFEPNKKYNEKLKIKKSDKYLLKITGKDTKGKFNISWKIQS